MATPVKDPTWNVQGWTAQYATRQEAGATAVPAGVWDANLTTPKTQYLIHVNGV
jgi:hypothetical protein